MKSRKACNERVVPVFLQTNALPVLLITWDSGEIHSTGGFTPVQVEQAVAPGGWVREGGVLQNRAVVVAATGLDLAPVCVRTALAVAHRADPFAGDAGAVVLATRPE